MASREGARSPGGRVRRAQRRVWLLAPFLALSPGARPIADAAQPVEITSQLVGLGARVPGSSSHAAARELLSVALQGLPLEDVGELAKSGDHHWRSLGAVLPGRAGPAVVLTAHYDSVEGSPGALDNASGCGTVLGAVADLATTPRQRPVRVLLFDGEESLAAGSRAWLSSLSQNERQEMLATLVVDMVGARPAGPGVLHILSARGERGRATTPAWLVHAALQGAATLEFPVTVLDRRWSWFAQLAVRCVDVRRVTDGHRFLERGVPALLVSDSSLTAPSQHYHRATDRLEVVDPARLEQWSRVLAAMARRIDGLAGLPKAESEYLVLGGRVWIRRDLVWAGFLLWVLLVWAGRPGRWRGASSSERRRLGRLYLPGFAFRMLFLLAVFSVPVFSTLLLYPAAGLGLLTAGRSIRVRRLGCALGTLPALAFLSWLTAGQIGGSFVLERVALLPVTLVIATLSAYCGWLLDTTRSKTTERPGY